MKSYLALAGCSILFLSGCRMPTNSEQPSTMKAVPEITRTLISTETTDEQARIERFTIHSPSMNREIKVAVVLPPEYEAHPEKRYPILYTLHGANAPWDTWAKMSKLRALLKDKPFIYTCFDGDAGSNYIDSPVPIKTARKGEEDETRRASLFTTFFFEEFVPGIDSWYRIDGDRRGVTGFSMGGFGAFHYMLERPDFFNSVSGLSSAYLDTGDMTDRRKSWMESQFGKFEENRESYEAIDHYIRFTRHIKGGVQFPPLYSHCGTGDFLLEENRKMSAFLKAYDISIEYVETSGAHDWKFWHPASVGVAEFHWKHFSE